MSKRTFPEQPHHLQKIQRLSSTGTSLKYSDERKTTFGKVAQLKFQMFVYCSWRNEKATFKEKKIEIATEKLPGHDHAADHIFVGLPEDKCKL